MLIPNPAWFRIALTIISCCLALTAFAATDPGSADTQPLPPPDDDSSEVSALEARIEQERKTMDYRFVITPHKPSYLLPLTYNWTPNNKYQDTVGGELDNAEIKFQLSLKIPVWESILGKGSLLSFGYTQLSFWQAYNTELSRPFRETNHEPELMLSFLTDTRILGLTGKLVTVGLVHQSNGRSEPVSRSWNRIYVDFSFAKKSLALDIKPWYRLPEGDKEDENPGIKKYMGYGELTLAYIKTDRVFSMMLRNNFASNNRGAVELNWSVPFTRRLHGYVQYFSGYGESLVDYNASTDRLGIGVLLINWI